MSQTVCMTSRNVQRQDHRNSIIIINTLSIFVPDSVVFPAQVQKFYDYCSSRFQAGGVFDFVVHNESFCIRSGPNRSFLCSLDIFGWCLENRLHIFSQVCLTHGVATAATFLAVELYSKLLHLTRFRFYALCYNNSYPSARRCFLVISIYVVVMLVTGQAFRWCIEHSWVYCWLSFATFRGRWLQRLDLQIQWPGWFSIPLIDSTPSGICGGLISVTN